MVSGYVIRHLRHTKYPLLLHLRSTILVEQGTTGRWVSAPVGTTGWSCRPVPKDSFGGGEPSPGNRCRLKSGPHSTRLMPYTMLHKSCTRRASTGHLIPAVTIRRRSGAVPSDLILATSKQPLASSPASSECKARVERAASRRSIHGDGRSGTRPCSF